MDSPKHWVGKGKDDMMASAQATMAVMVKGRR